MSDLSQVTPEDETFMAEAIRISRTHLGRTGTNPSVGTVIAKNGVVIGRGVTAIGGRPHAETIALAEAGKEARGATAYVTLEPCAHHGRTPPCAQALIDAGIKRVVCALTDPDDRVGGRGFVMLHIAGVAIAENCMAKEARKVLGSYLNRCRTKQAQVTLKLAVSADGAIGRKFEGQIPITGPESKEAVHKLRSEHEAIMVGIGTVLSDNPDLTVRLPDKDLPSPRRVVVDTHARMPLDARMLKNLDVAPVIIATCEAQGARAKALQKAGATILPCDMHDGHVALPELMQDLAAMGVTRVFLEGGAELANAFLDEKLVERIYVFKGPGRIGDWGIPSPVTETRVPVGFAEVGRVRYGEDEAIEYEPI